MKKETSAQDAAQLVCRLEWMGLRAFTREENMRHFIAIVQGTDEKTSLNLFANLPGVEKVVPFTTEYILAGREFKRERTCIRIKDQEIGGNKLAVIAGPCVIESEKLMYDIASLVAKSGATILRGGAFKPRTSPYSFQGLGEEGLKFISAAAQKYNLLSISEVMDTRDIELVANYVDILQIGARNMQNFSLLKQAGKANVPVLLKRGMSATYQDFLMAAEYILKAGNPNVILCERGFRTFETYSRNTLDIAAVPILKELSHLPVIVDPSHGTGLRSMVPPMARAAVAAGAHGIMVEVHPEPDRSLSDAKQTISPETFAEMLHSLKGIGKVVNMQVG
ncbi:3-deoxy-7-phosphoheptulonate synthase [Candidatus Riflebacteria bacterium]